MGSKDAPQTMKRCASNNAVLKCNKKSGKSVRFYTKRKSGGKIPHIWPSPKQNRSESQCSCIIQKLMNRGKYAYMGLWVKYALVKSSGFLKSRPRSKKRRITVSVFLSTLQLTALLLKKFRLRLHCYTLKKYDRCGIRERTSQVWVSKASPPRQEVYFSSISSIQTGSFSPFFSHSFQGELAPA